MTDFPMDTVIFNKIVEVFNQTRGYVLLLFPLAFFIRIAFGFILLKGPESFTDILKDSLFLFLGLFFFTDILKLTLQIPYFISQELSSGEWRNINLEGGIFTKVLKRIVDWVGILAYWISFGLYVVLISILGFFAGYILFLGTMFRAYGMLKVFFILLFVISLWPLLWHSINFAVWTIAVSDNALANNVIVGGASLAKVMLPLWLISKTSKIPVSEKLRKISWASSNLIYHGGSRAYSALTSKSENILNRKEITNKEEIDTQGAEISVTQTENINNSSITESLPHFEGAYMGVHEDEPEDFSLRQREPEAIHFKNKEALPLAHNQDSKHQGINRNVETREILSKESQTKESVKQENHTASHVQNETTVKNTVKATTELHAEDSFNKPHGNNNFQIKEEITKPVPVSSESQVHNKIIQSQEEVSRHETSLTPDGVVAYRSMK